VNAGSRHTKGTGMAANWCGSGIDFGGLAVGRVAANNPIVLSPPLRRGSYLSCYFLTISLITENYFLITNWKENYIENHYEK
jgi:hypothetical protein